MLLVMLLKTLYQVEKLVLRLLYPLLNKRSEKLRSAVIPLPPKSELAFLKNSEPKPTLLIIGESTAAGVGASKEETTFANQVYQELGQEFQVLNLGKNGLKAAELPQLFASAKIVPPSIAVVVILIGANDCFGFTNPKEFAQEILSFAAQLHKKYGTIKTVIQVIPPVHLFPAIPWIGKVLLGMHRYLLSHALQAKIKDYPMIEFMQNKQKFEASFFASDGIHPSDRGYAALAKHTTSYIKKGGFNETTFYPLHEPLIKP
jgi:lysophospholipase L1-like esterase